MKLKRFLFLFLVSAFAAVPVSAAPAIPSGAMGAAESALERFKSDLLQDPALFPSVKEADPDLLSVGGGFRIKRVSPALFSDGDTLLSISAPTEIWYFPIELQGRSIAFVWIRQEGERFREMAVGDAEGFSDAYLSAKNHLRQSELVIAGITPYLVGFGNDDGREYAIPALSPERLAARGYRAGERIPSEIVGTFVKSKAEEQAANGPTRGGGDMLPPKPAAEPELPRYPLIGGAVLLFLAIVAGTMYRIKRRNPLP